LNEITFNIHIISAWKVASLRSLTDLDVDRLGWFGLYTHCFSMQPTLKGYLTKCEIWNEEQVTGKYSDFQQVMPNLSRDTTRSVVLKVLTPQDPYVKFSSICIRLFNKV